MVMMITFGQAVNGIKTVATSHPLVKRAIFEFDSEIAEYISKDSSFSIVLVKPALSGIAEYYPETTAKQYAFEIEVLDRLMKDRTNVLKVVSECERVADYIINQIVNEAINGVSLDIERFPVAEAVTNSRFDYLAGVKFTIYVNAISPSSCLINGL